MLIILGGLPATGKSTVAKALSARRSAVYLRVDEVEGTLRSNGVSEVGATGYFVVQALAASNLGLGHEVIGDSVNPVEESRESWRETAKSVGSDYVEVELICSDTNEHRKRAEQRVVGIEGIKQPSWQDICDRDYETWSSVDLKLDTAALSVTEAVDAIEGLIESRKDRKRS